jgi:hypothetical protein
MEKVVILKAKIYDLIEKEKHNILQEIKYAPGNDEILIRINN